MTEKVKHPDEQTIVIMSFDKNQYYSLHWFKKGKEFLFKDMMYDIVKVEETAYGSLKVFALPDKKDALITRLLNSSQGSRNQSSLPITKNHFSFQLNPVFYFEYSEQAHSEQFASTFRYFTKIINHFDSFISEVITPPPESIS